MQRLRPQPAGNPSESAFSVDKPRSAPEPIPMSDDSIEQPGHKWTYDEMAARADEARSILLDKGLRIPPLGTLHAMLNKPRELRDVWRDDGVGMPAKMALLIDAGNANRVADAVLNSRDDVDADTMTCLDRLARHPIDLESRSSSQAKDAFWELDLLSRLRRHGVAARLAEPPDLVADFGFGDYGIACKKTYSEKGVEVQVRKGAQQIAKAGLRGIVAINLDELAPAYEIMRQPTARAASDALAGILQDFIERHRMRIQRFVHDGRCDALLLSMTAHVEAEHSRPSFSTFSQMSIWTLSEASTESKRRLREVARAFPGALSGGSWGHSEPRPIAEAEPI